MSVEFTDNSAKVKSDYENALKRVLTKIGMKAEANVKPKVPVDTGNLRNSIKYEVKENEKSVYVGSTQKDPPYSIFIELGTSKMRAQPYLKPGVDETTREVPNILKQEFGNMK